jgi:hypothetical protein
MKTPTLMPMLVGFALGACGTSDSGVCDPAAPKTICTIAGQGTSGYGGDNGNALDAYLFWPQDTVIAPSGDVWIEDFNNYLVRAVSPDGMIKTVIGTGLLGDSPTAAQGDRCPALQADFNHTTSLVFNGDYLYMSAWHGSRVKRVNYGTMEVENFAGTGARTYFFGDDGPALNAALDLPTSVAIDADGNVAIMDQANQAIRQVDAAGNIHRIAGRCVIEQTPCAVGEVPRQCPNSEKFACGNLDLNCGKTGDVYGTADCTLGFSGDGGPALDLRMGQEYGQMARPSGRIVYDLDGNLIFADSTNNRIRKINKSDGIVNTIVGNGTSGYAGDGGPAKAAEINFPVDVAIGPDNSLYFADFNNSCIRKVDPAGTITTVAGTCSPNPKDWGFSGDGGLPTEAKLNQPSGIDVVGTKLYISDTYNNRVRVVNL